MNLFKRFLAETPWRNKIIGRELSALTGFLTAIEGVLIAYNAPVPAYVHQTIIAIGVISLFLSGYHGQKVKKDLPETE